MSDFVSRDEVFLAIALTDFVRDSNYADGEVLLYEEDLKNRIRDLPSARLDVSDSGLVSRRDVINAIEGTDWYHINKKGKMVHGSTSELESWYKHDDIMDAVESVPSAEPKMGKWIIMPEFCGDDVSGFTDNHWRCSECKKEAEINLCGFYVLSDFCPHCGADMRGEHNE